MKYLKKWKIFENHDDIHNICKEYDIKNYTIKEDGTIDVNGNVHLSKRSLTKLPLRFNHVSGDFSCLENKLTTLEGAPESINGGFLCDNNELTNLKGGPKNVSGGFYCRHNQLTSLEGAPLSVGGDFWGHNNKLTSFKNAPQSVGGEFYCYNNQIKSLDGLEFKSFEFIDLENNPVYDIVKDWINSDNREELIEYFVDLSVIQEENKLIMVRLDTFYEDMELEMNIDWKEVKKYYEIIN